MPCAADLLARQRGELEARVESGAELGAGENAHWRCSECYALLPGHVPWCVVAKVSREIDRVTGGSHGR